MKLFLTMKPWIRHTMKLSTGLFIWLILNITMSLEPLDSGALDQEIPRLKIGWRISWMQLLSFTKMRLKSGSGTECSTTEISCIPMIAKGIHGAMIWAAMRGRIPNLCQHSGCGFIF